MELVNELYAVGVNVGAGGLPTQSYPCSVREISVPWLCYWLPSPVRGLRTWEMLGEQSSLLRAPCRSTIPRCQEDEVEIPVADQWQAAQPMSCLQMRPRTMSRPCPGGR